MHPKIEPSVVVQYLKFDAKFDTNKNIFHEWALLMSKAAAGVVQN